MAFLGLMLEHSVYHGTHGYSSLFVSGLCRLRFAIVLQATMVASWMVELHLDQINRALLEETPEAGSKSPMHAESLRTFLKDHVEILDVNVTISLLASYGRMDDLMHYATYRQVCINYGCIGLQVAMTAVSTRIEMSVRAANGPPMLRNPEMCFEACA